MTALNAKSTSDEPQPATTVKTYFDQADRNSAEISAAICELKAVARRDPRG
jgi:hypothetical protein